MKDMAPEFSRRIGIARLPPSGSSETIAATPEECAALARRLGLPSVLSLAATLRAEPWRRGGAKVSGALKAEVEQTCVVTLDNFTSTIREPVERYYIPSRIAEGASEEDEADIVAEGIIDIGELAAETLALALNPYPRKPGAVFEPAETEAAAAERSRFSGLLERKAHET